MVPDSKRAMHMPLGAGAAATTSTTQAATAAECSDAIQGTAQIQTPTARWGVAIQPMAAKQLVPTTSAVKATAPAKAHRWPRSSAEAPTAEAPTHPLKAPIPPSSFYSWRNKLI